MTFVQYYKKYTKKLLTITLSLFCIVIHQLEGQTPAFSFSLSNNCAPAVVTFYNESDMSSGYTFMWDFGKGGVVFSSEEILEEVYNNPGTYDVSLSIINGSDTTTTTKILNLAQGPTAAFEVQNNSGCIPLSIVMNDASTPGDGAITDYFWDLRNGQTLSGNPAYYTYTTTGNFDIFYRITDANGCTSYYEATQIIQANAQPIANFSASEQFACDPPLYVSFTNLSTGTGTLTSSWNLGDGTTANTLEASNTYNSSGSYNISLKITDALGCTDSILRPAYINIGKPEGKIIAVYSNDTISDDDSTICPGKVLITSTLPEQPDYKWIINYKGAEQIYTDSTGLHKEFSDSGQVDIKLIYGQTGLCPDTIARTFYIEYLAADFQMNKEYSCKLPFNVELEDLSLNAYKYKWIFPDLTLDTTENTQYDILKPKSYLQTYAHQIQDYDYEFVLIAENINGCVDTVIKNFKASLPVARFMPDNTSGCAPLDVNFYDSSKSVEDIAKWTYFVNSEEITVNNKIPVPYTFDTPGEYDVVSVITNDSGCVDTSYPVKIRVGDILDPDFSISSTPVCYGDSIQMTVNTVIPDPNITWIFSSPGIFNTGETKNSPASVRILPDTTGFFPVKFELNYNGCLSDSTIQNGIEVNGPVGGFTEKFDCDTPLHYSFFADLADYDNLIWEIEDSVYNNKDTVEHTFTQSGDYTVTLTASNSGSGCTVVKRKIIKVREVTAKIDVKSVACLSEPVIFSSAGSIDYIDSCYNEGFVWDWDDDQPDRKTYNTLYIHAYTDTGMYNVKLEVTGDNGCKATDSTIIRITAPFPEITATPVSGCGPSMLVTLEYTNHTAEIDSWDWIYDNFYYELGSTDTIVSHTYIRNISTVVYPQIRVRDIYGCQGNTSVPVEINVVSSEFQSNRQGICPGDEVFFVFYENAADSFLIDFGDGNSTLSKTSYQSHQYNSPGQYDVSLTVWKGGCVVNRTKPDFITVSDIDATFTTDSVTSTCYPVTIRFTHSNPSSSVIDGLWDFGDGTGSSVYIPSVQYTYTKPGTYISTLQVRSINNCIAKDSVEIIIGGPKAEFVFSPTNICSGESVQFNLLNIQDADEFTWVFGDGETSVVNDTNPKHTYLAKGLLTPSIRMKQGSCEVLYSTGDLFVSLVNADFEIDHADGQYCQNDRINATNLSSSYTLSQWMLDDALLTTDSNLINLVLTLEGNHTLQLIVSDLANCKDSLSETITVNPLPDYTIQGVASICFGNSASLSIPDFNQTWSVDWSPNDIFSNSTEPNTSASPDSTITVTAFVTNENGCSAFRIHEIYVEGDYTILRIPEGDTSIFLGEHLQLLTTIDKNDVTYTWSPNNHISCTDCLNPVVNPTETTTYILTTSDTCSEKTENFLVEVITDHYLEFPKAFTPNGDRQNDIFTYEYDNIGEVDFKIFNRWGNLVFSSTKVGEGWDGRTNNKMQNVDTYTYYIRAKTIHGFEFEKKGTFLLLK